MKDCGNDLILKARRLRSEGKVSIAEDVLRVAANEGCVEAMIELAHFARDAGRLEESNDWIDAAENSVDVDDLNGHVALSGAYSLGLGRGELADLQRRAAAHLNHVALAGNSVAQEDLALQYLYGLNGLDRNDREFEKLIEMAIKGGSLRAIYIYSKYLIENGMSVPDEMKKSLMEIRHRNKSVDNLLKLIEKIEDIN